MPILFDWNFAKRDDGEDANNYLIASYGCVFGIALPRFIIIFIWGSFDDGEVQDFVSAFRSTHSDNRDPPDKSTFFRAHDRVTVEYWGCTFEDDEPEHNIYELVKYFAKAFGPQQGATVHSGLDIAKRCKLSQYAFRVHHYLMIEKCIVGHTHFPQWRETGMFPSADLAHVVRTEFSSGTGFRLVMTRPIAQMDPIDDRAPPLNLTDDRDPWADAPISSMIIEGQNRIDDRARPSRPRPPPHPPPHTMSNLTDAVGGGLRDPCLHRSPGPPADGEVSVDHRTRPLQAWEHGRWPEGQLHGRMVEETTHRLPPWASVASSSQGGGQDSQKRKLEHKCKLICPEGHQPVSVLSQSRGICDVCTCAVEAGQHVMDCEPCNYYVCNHCFGAMDGELVAVIAKGALQHVGYVAEDTSSMYADHTPSAEDWLNTVAG